MAFESETAEANLVPDNISTLPGGNPSYRKPNEGFLKEQRQDASRLASSLQPKPLVAKSQVAVASLLSNVYFEAFSCVLFTCFTLLVTVELSFGFPSVSTWDTSTHESLFATNITFMSYFALESILKALAFYSLCCSTLLGVDVALSVACLALEIGAISSFRASGGVGEKEALFVASNISKQVLILYKVSHLEFYYVIMAVIKNKSDRQLIRLIQERLQRVRSSLDPQSNDVASLNWIIYRIGCVLRMKRSHCANTNPEDDKVDFAGLDEETRRYLLETYSRKPTELRRQPMSSIDEEEHLVLESGQENFLARSELAKRETPREKSKSPTRATLTGGTFAHAVDSLWLHERDEPEDESDVHGNGSGKSTLTLHGVFDDGLARAGEENLQTQDPSQQNEPQINPGAETRRSAFIPREPYPIPEDNEAKMPHVKIKVAEKVEKQTNGVSYIVSDNVPRRYSLKNPKRKRSSLTSVASSPIFGIRRLFAPVTTANTQQASSIGGSESLDIENPAENKATQKNRHVTGNRCGLRDTDVKILSDRLVELYNIEPISWNEALLEQVNIRMDEWFFDIFWLDRITGGHPLCYVTSAILRKNALYSVLNLCECKVHNFLIQIEDGYLKENPYHNAIHAADVVQTIHVFFTYNQLRDQLTYEDVLCALLAAAIHDYKHPGVNNSFLTAVNSPLALQYNDRSVLEHMHVASAFKLMVDKPDCDVLSCFNTREAFYAARESIIQMVLATDMSQHFEGVEQFKTMVLGARTPLVPEAAFGLEHSSNAGSRKIPVAGERKRADGENTFESVEERLLPLSTRRVLLNTTLHCADLSNPAKPIELARKWALLVQEEMFLQGDKERDLELPISMFMDRKKHTLYKCQIGFLTIIIKPLFGTFCQFVPSMSETIEECINQNLTYWQRNQDELEATLGRTRTMSNIDRASSSDRIDARTSPYNRQRSSNSFASFWNQSLPIRRAASSNSVSQLSRFTGSTTRRASAKGA